MLYNRLKRKIRALCGGNNRFIGKYRNLLKESPLNAELHFQFGKEALKRGNFPLAIAELKTSMVLGKTKHRVQQYLHEAISKTSPLITMDHNTYFRFETLKREVLGKVDDMENFSVLDIGGGEGVFAQFVPTENYCLVEPEVNGISGVCLPFEDKSFDIVVACHVLEHIPQAQRDEFLTQLCQKAKKAVVLLNPFYVEGLDEKKRLQFHVDVTGAWWAKEHLEFSLPTLDDVKAFADQKGINFVSKPNGSLALSFASVYVDHFGNKVKSREALDKVNMFMNESFTDIAVSDMYPNAYVVSLTMPCKDLS